jgi:crotonobetainyl-CoA:carnitine CoA-transferase CaiB-like acyl-CoA transferase
MLDATAGLRVLDLTEGLAGPLVTMILADFGAEVVRVSAEAAKGPDEPSHLLLDRGKKHLHVDLRSAEGVAALRELVPTSMSS